MEWESKTGHCEAHCKNKTDACYSCEENNDCDCVKKTKDNCKVDDESSYEEEK